MLQYKLKLASVSGLATGGEAPLKSGITIAARWSTHQLSERIETPNPYEASVEFPQLMPDEDEFAEVNIQIKAHAFALIQEARRLSLSEPPPPDDWWSKLDNVFAGSYEILLFERNFLSLKYTQYQYGAGAAHGISSSSAYNYRLAPLLQMHHSDLFLDLGAALQVLSNYCIESIEGQKGVTTPDEWVRRGSAPEWGNFACMNLLRGGVLVTFSDYQVGSYADGPRTVFVPAQKLAPLINPRSRVGELWK